MVFFGYYERLELIYEKQGFNAREIIPARPPIYGDNDNLSILRVLDK